MSKIALDTAIYPHTFFVDKEHSVMYETRLDIDELQRLAKKALLNKNWKAKQGPITVQILARQPLKKGPENE